MRSSKTILKHIKYIYDIETMPIKIKITNVDLIGIFAGEPHYGCIHYCAQIDNYYVCERNYGYNYQKESYDYFIEKFKKQQLEFFLPIGTEADKQVRQKIKEIIEEKVLNDISWWFYEIARTIEKLDKQLGKYDKKDLVFESEFLKTMDIEKIILLKPGYLFCFDVNINGKLERIFEERKVFRYLINKKIDIEYLGKIFKLFEDIEDYITFLML